MGGYNHLASLLLTCQILHKLLSLLVELMILYLSYKLPLYSFSTVIL